MVIRKIVVCTACTLAVFAAAGCADGTGSALTPVLPSPTEGPTANADGTKLKATAPQIAAPRAGNRVSNLTPTLRLTNGSPEFDPTAVLSYVFEVYDEATLIATSEPVTGSGSETTWNVPSNVLGINRVYSWRGRAVYNGVAGTWSDGAFFRTPVGSVAPETPGPVPCAGSSGKEIAQCVADAYPEKLVATSAGDFSLERRWANMEFLRDRIIETGLCKGLNLGWNLKRGGPEISRDFMVLRGSRGKHGTDRGVDVASGYDAVREKLRLGFAIHDDPDKSYGHPFYKKYDKPFDCSGV